MALEDDCWDAFGSDEDDDEDDVIFEDEYSSSVALHLSQFFLIHDAHVKLPERVIGLIDESKSGRAALEQRGMQVVNDFTSQVIYLDGLVVLDNGADDVGELIDRLLLAGGILISHDSLSISDKDFLEPTDVYNSNRTRLVARKKKAVHAHATICPWLPSSHSLKVEEENLQQATVTLSSYEVSQSRMTNTSIARAVHSINKYGYCVIRNLLDPNKSELWGKAVLESVHSAAKILLDRDRVDIFHPQTSNFEPQSYRELSMREDLRLDLRHGPELSKLRSMGKNGNQPYVLSAATKEFDGFLRGHASLLEIVRRVMNPQKGKLYKGNLGRFNFGGSGADGSFQDLRVSPVGGIVSFPGAADQAIHADTPHLFEHLPDLPAHYINIFTPGIPFDEEVGGTAFCHGSHNLVFTAEHCGDDDDNSKVYPFLVRPCLTLGDVVLFDCRILHFGLSNTSNSVERVLLYTNTTQAWFHDPKDWDNQRPIFEDIPKI